MAAAREISSLEEARRSARRIVWDDALWLVFEFVEVFDRRQAPSLVFESDTTVRRVRNYPADWRALSDEELVALSWSV